MSRLYPVLIAVIHAGLSKSASAGEADQAKVLKTVTLVVAFDESQAQPEVVEALKSELAEIWRGEPVKLNWRPLELVQPGDSFEDLVVVHFRGDCHVHPLQPFLIDERGPQGRSTLAYSTTVNGEVQPFSSVLCERVERSVQSAMKPNQRKTASKLYGRALGRVLSHELYHILNQTKNHEDQGLAKKSLTAQQLIAPKFRFDPANAHAGH